MKVSFALYIFYKFLFRWILIETKWFQTTDITEHALEALTKSRVKRVYVVGRRGPLQVAFTPAELREMVKIPECRPVFPRAYFEKIREKMEGKYLVNSGMNDFETC